MTTKPPPAAPRYRVDPETFPCERCAVKDAEIAEWSLKYAAEVVRANKAEAEIAELKAERDSLRRLLTEAYRFVASTERIQAEMRAIASQLLADEEGR